MPPRDVLARQVLERLISEKAQLQLARETGIKVDEPTVDQAEQNVARQNQIDVAELRRAWRPTAWRWRSFRDELRSQLLLHARARARGRAPRAHHDLEVDQFIQEQQGSNDTWRMELNLGQVLVACPKGATPPRSHPAGQGRARAGARRAGEDFARWRARCPTRRALPTGRADGPAPGGPLPAAVHQRGAGLPDGGISGVVRRARAFMCSRSLKSARPACRASTSPKAGRATSCCARGPAERIGSARAAGGLRKRIWPARPTLPSWPVKTRRTAALATAATWAGPTPACLCRSSKTC
jgi:peptidyl-prolyl cis-trans isomerase SurA